MSTHFSPEALKFLRGLIRNNDRDWFEARRDIYERSVKTPLLALVDEINTAMLAFAPDHVRPASKITMRIYRDIRFSKDKRPYKRHVSAWWSRRGMEKTSGAGFYLQISPSAVLLAAGVYMPERDQLLSIRRWMSANHAAYRSSVSKLLKSKITAFTPIDAQPLTRMPKGFASDDPADELLRAKNWGVHASLPSDVALDPTLADVVLRHFKSAAPLVDILNNAILDAQTSSQSVAESRNISSAFALPTPQIRRNRA
jgi:uncharacterized protein (TIGR02453 family)